MRNSSFPDKFEFAFLVLIRKPKTKVASLLNALNVDILGAFPKFI